MNTDIPHKTPTQLLADELIDDIEFLGHHGTIERAHAIADKMGCLRGNWTLQPLLRAVQSDIPPRIEELTAAARHCAEALGTGDPAPQPVGAARTLAVGRKQKAPEKVKISAPKLETRPALLPVEYLPDGTAFRWSGINPEFEFRLAVDRSQNLECRLVLVSLIKPEHGKALDICVDGEKVPHRFFRHRKRYVASISLPQHSSAGYTSIRVRLPGTHSPLELGASQDDRKLGLAICELRIGPSDGPISRFLQLVRLKK